jgi:hypothetical protein
MLRRILEIFYSSHPPYVTSAVKTTYYVVQELIRYHSITEDPITSDGDVLKFPAISRVNVELEPLFQRLFRLHDYGRCTEYPYICIIYIYIYIYI